MTLISGLDSASTRIGSDQDVPEQAAEEAVEPDGLGERKPQPHQTLELAAELGLPGDGLDHRAEDVADAGTCTRRAGADAEREGDCLAGVDDRRVLDGDRRDR